jgi:hypothetical protein
METNGTQPAKVSETAVRLQPFWADRPAVLFAHTEVQFSLAGISKERTTFYYVISQLDHRYAAEVEDITTSQPQQDPYTKLRTEFSRSSWANVRRHLPTFQFDMSSMSLDGQCQGEG